MEAMVPLVITPAMLISSSVAEPSAGEVAWNSGTSYVAGDVVILVSTHRKYTCLQANSNKDPSSSSNYAYWSDTSPTNKYAMFAGDTTLQTLDTGNITVVLQVGFFNALCLFDIYNADNLTITVKDSPAGTVVYSYSGNLEQSTVCDWYEYYFSPFNPKTKFVASGIPPYATSEVTISITGSGTVGCGITGFGDLRYLGETEMGAKATPKSYSSIIVNSDGSQKLLKRRAGNDISCTCYIELEDANNTHATLMQLLDIPALWVGTELSDYEGLLTWGKGTGTISYDHPTKAILTIDVQGLIR